ncbi:MAG: TIGR04282 family arsenosugar biosynthesis glycosyltransferase, partial [Pyrinomonadaceae bacterium]
MPSPYMVLDPRVAAPESGRGACALGIMIKAPRAGASKTRLAPPLTLAEAAALSVCFLRDTARNIAEAATAAAAAVAREQSRVDGVAVYTPVGAQDAFDGLLPPGFLLLPQRGEAFGARLFHAAEDFARLGYDSFCLIDSDSPTLPRAALKEAVRFLSLPGDRIVLGPADDGGYYLIGLKRPHRRVFADITWSTERVLAQTVERAAEIDLAVELLPAWYDVDDGPTLARLCEELFAKRYAQPESTIAREEMVGYEAPHTRA